MRKLYVILLMLVVAVLLAGCSDGNASDETSVQENTTVQAEVTTETETETTASGTKIDEAETTEAWVESGIDLSQYKIVLSKYASDCERDAAKTLSEMFSGLEIIDDTAEPTEFEILVGWTKRADNPTKDFDTIGENGYAVTMKNKKLMLVANSEKGMDNAVGFIRENLTEKGRFMESETQVIENEAVTIPLTISGEWGNTIAYADTLKNTISEQFTDKMRHGLQFNNLNMRLNYNLAGEEKRVSSFANSKGVAYFLNSSDVFVTSKRGTTLYASESETSGRMNTYRMGYYYRDIHILNQTFSKTQYDEDAGSLNVLEKVKTMRSNMTTVPQKDADGIWSYNVTNATDPYVTFNTNYSTGAYNALKLVVRTQNSLGGHVYYIAGGQTWFNSEQNVGFSIPATGEWATVYIYLGNSGDYTGMVKGLRFDIGDTNNELIEIKEVKAINISYDGVNVGLDRTYHTYSDKMHEELHFVYLDDDDRMKNYGMEIRLDADRVLGLRAVDKNGTHEKLEGVDWDSVEYLGFDIERAGIIGWIRSLDTDNAKFSVEKENGSYVVRLTVTNVKDSYKKGDELYLACRVYTSDKHDFEDFLNEGYIERHPLTNIKMNSKLDGAKFVAYDANRGCYRYFVKGTNFNIYYSDKYKNFKINSTISGDDRDRKLYVLGESASGCLENAVVLSGDDLMLPIQVETCKNFCGEHEEPIYDKGDAEYGEAIFPILLGSDEVLDFKLLHLYANWGEYAIKQLSSIQFIAPYYHLSCGTTESNCIAPYYVYGKDYWTLPDFRSMSAPFWSGQPQHTSVGRLYFLTYTDADGNFFGTENTHDDIDSSGPSYADITMNYSSDDGKISATYRHLEFPQYDENRTFYEINLEVLEDLSINDFKNNFSLFSFDGRMIMFRKMGYLNENNKEVVEDVDVNSSTPTYITLGKDHPYFDYYLCKESGDYVNFALLIKNSKITLNGKVIDNPFVIKNVCDGTLNYCYLTLDLGDITLKAGDLFEIDMILMPWGCQKTVDDSNVRSVRNDSCLKPIEVTASVGEVIADKYMPKVMAKDNVAEFTLKNGGGTTAVRVYGFDFMTKPTIQYKDENGKWKDCAISKNAYDGYTVYYDGDGKYSFAFNTDMGTGVERMYRVTK